MGQTTLSERLRAVEAEIAAGRPDRALELCQQVAAHYPRALAVQRVLGEVYLALRKPREALGSLDRALEGNPEDARACCARAIVHQIHGNPAGALDLYRRACDISPDDQALRAAYRELATSLGQPPYQPTRRGLARLYLRGDLLPHAIREWETLLAEQPDSREAQVGLAEALWRSGATRAAEERCRRILANAPSCIKPLLILAVLAHDTGNPEEAERLVRRARELDPDQRIAQTLLADRLVADLPLRALILGADHPFDGAASRPFPSQHAPAVQPAGRAQAWSRPLVEHQTGGPVPQAMPTGPIPAPPPNGTLTGPLAQVPAPAPVPRSAPVSHDIRSIFAETEYMLWSREDTERMQAVRPPQAPARGPVAPHEPERVERGGSSSVLMPPALRDQGFNLEETEARAAINWVHWLQAQGARPRPGQLPAQPAAPQAAPSVHEPAQPRQTGALHQTTPDALRQMFEVLNTDTTSPRVVEADSLPPAHTPPQESLADATPTGEWDHQPETFRAQADATAFPSATYGAAARDDASPWDAGSLDTGASAAVDAPAPSGHDFDEPSASEDYGSPAFDPGWSAASESLDSSLAPDPAPPGVPAWAFGGAASPHFDDPDGGETVAEAGAPSGPVTIEALEHGFASSGFEPVDLEPGTLARIAAASQPLAASETPDASPVAEPGSERPAPPPTTTDLSSAHEDLVPTTYALGETGNASAESRPDPEDYPARLELARQWHGEGRTEDALAEYRTILRNAPDQLSAVMGDLDGVISANPDHAAAHKLMGDALVRQGDYIRALELYNRAVALGDGQAS